MRSFGMLLVSLSLLLGCSFRPATTGGAAPPNRRNPVLAGDRHDWFFNPVLRILPPERAALLGPIPSAPVTAEAVGERDCREVRVTDPAQDRSGASMQNEVSVAVRGASVVVTYNDDNEPRDTMSGYAISLDGGRTFADGGPVLPSADYFGGGDPLILADPADPQRWLYFQLTYGSNTSSLLMHESVDGGRTFPPERTVNIFQRLLSPWKGKPLFRNNMFHDKEWGVFTPDGRVLIAWTLFADTNADGWEDEVVPAAVLSRDGGRTWSDAVSLVPAGQMGGLTAVEAGPQGELYVAFLDFRDGSLRFVRSLDGGETWDAPVTAVPVFQSPYDQAATNACGRTALNGNIRITSVPSLSADPVTGALYLVYNYKETQGSPDDSDIGFVVSSDRGATWSAPVRINDDATTADQFMPWVASAGGGNVAVMFYDRRDDPANLAIHVYLAQSLDGGLTWLRNRRVTCSAFEPVEYSCYMGDYNQMVFADGSYQLAWGDNRNLLEADGLPQPDVYFTRLSAWPRVRPLEKPE